MRNKLPVMESFLSIQGEGYHQGLLSYFIRLAGCDVGCTWCDVKESWPVEESQFRNIDDLIAEIKETPAKTIIVTGGEPLMYNLKVLTDKLHAGAYKIHLETSGAYKMSGDFDWITLSPKKFKKPLNEIYNHADEIKVIIAGKKDFEWAEAAALKVKPDCHLYLQAEWDRKEKQYPRLYSYIAEHPTWKISVQSHKYLGIP